MYIFSRLLLLIFHALVDRDCKSEADKLVEEVERMIK